MTAFVYDVKVGNFAQSTTVNVPLTGLVPTDLLVVITSQRSAAPVTVGGIAAGSTLFGSRQVAASLTVIRVRTKTGVSDGNVTLSVGSLGFWNQYTILVLRDLNSAAITAFADSTWYAVDGVTTGSQETTPADTDEGPAALSVGVDQIAVFIACAQNVANAAITFPSNPTPAAGWVTDALQFKTGDGSHLAAHKVISAPSNAQANIRASGTGGVFGTLMLIFGTPSAAPLRRFRGWGIPI